MTSYAHGNSQILKYYNNITCMLHLHVALPIIGNIILELTYSEELVDASEVELLQFVDVDKVAIQ